LNYNISSLVGGDDASSWAFELTPTRAGYTRDAEVGRVDYAVFIAGVFDEVQGCETLAPGVFRSRVR
jgi:hypothetical protein